MKAVFIDRFGGPEVLTYGDQPDPVTGPGQVVVDVTAASGPHFARAGRAAKLGFKALYTSWGGDARIAAALRLPVREPTAGIALAALLRAVLVTASGRAD